MKLQAQAQSEVQNPEIKKLEIGTNARVEMERMGATMQSNREDLQTRIRIAAGKEGTMTNIAQMESMTQRNVAGMNRMASLQKSLMDLKSKSEDRKAGQVEKETKQSEKESAKKSPKKA